MPLFLTQKVTAQGIYVQKVTSALPDPLHRLAVRVGILPTVPVKLAVTLVLLDTTAKLVPKHQRPVR